VQPDHLPGDDDGVALDDLGRAGERFGAPAERQNGDETPEHSATACCQIYQWRSISVLGLPLRVLSRIWPSRICVETARGEVDLIEVRRTGEDDPLEFEVVVRDGQGETRHHVMMARETSDRLTAGKHTPERCLEAAFRFLLDREPKESILSVTVISRYFPEFERELPRYLSQS
jgi:hypothetical protein